MNMHHPRSTLASIVALMVMALVIAPAFAAGETVDNSEAQAAVERTVAGMIADTMRSGYRQPPVSIVLVACTYAETGKRSEYSTWLESNIKAALLKQSGLGVMATGVAELLEAPQRENYQAFSKRIQADWMLRGSFVGEGSQVRVTLELVDLSTSQVLMLRSLSTPKVYSAEGRTLALLPAEKPDTQTSSGPTSSWVLIQLPEGLRADLKILDAAGQELKRYPESEGEQVKLEPGRYRLEAEDRLGQYYPYRQDFEVAGTRIRLEVSLKPRFGSLELRVEPAPGIDLTVNGRKEQASGAGLWVLEGLKAGIYEVVASKELYRTERRSVEVKEGEKTRVEIRLEEYKFRLEVAGGGGIGGKVLVDGIPRGSLPVSLELPFGRARVRVEPEDSRYRVWEKEVEPKAAGTVERVSVVFAERTGLVEIMTSPAVEATLRAREPGGAWREIGSAPMDWQAMVGEYELEGRALIRGQPGSGMVRVTIREGQVAQVRIVLTATGGTTPQPAPTTTTTVPRFVPTTTTTTSTTTTTTIPRVVPTTTTTTTLPLRSFLELRFVTGGNFMMGSKDGDADESPVHLVTLSSFLMARTEVTQAQYRAVTGSSPSEFTGANLPVEQVSWFDAVEFCNKLSEREGLQKVYTITGRSPASGYPITSAKVSFDMSKNGYRLPTEAEWEYAARGESQSREYAYSGSDDPWAVAWYTDNSADTTHAVGTKAANELGLYDMSGNVWEWCQDWYDLYATGALIDPTGAFLETDRVMRGGSWFDAEGDCRVSYRDCDKPDRWYDSVGFRPVRRH